MKKIYIPQGGGRDFWLRIPMNNESAGRHLCMDDVDENEMHVWLESGYGGCWTLEWEKDGAQRDGIAAKVPASQLGYGTYSVVMAGRFVNGDYFRTKRQLFIRLVDREDQADAEETMYNEEKAYWAGPAVLSEMLSRDGLNTYELAVLHGYDGTLEEFLEQVGIELQDLMVTKAKLSREVQTLLDKGAEKGITPMGAYSNIVNYRVNDMVYDATTNSSYISIFSENKGNAVTDTRWWKKAFDGNYVLNTIMEAAQQTLDRAKAATEQATENAIEATSAASAATAAATAAKDAANAVAAQKVAQAQIGYYECNSLGTDATKVTTTGTVGESTYVLTQNGGQMKIRMAQANSVDSNVKLQIGNTTALPLYYNGLPVSASNSWDAGEVISVYFDGTNYQASNAQGGSSRKIDAYLLGDLRTLAVGQTYNANEAVKTTDKQLRRLIRDISALSLTEELETGDLRVYSNNTYQSQKTAKNYDSSANYSSGTVESPVYAIGHPTKLTVTITRGTTYNTTLLLTDGTTSIDGGTITPNIADGASGIATAVYTALNSLENSGWTFEYLSDSNAVKATPSTAGDYSSYNLVFAETSGITSIPSYTTDSETGNTEYITFTFVVAAGSISVVLGSGEAQSVEVGVSDDATAIATSIAAKTFEGWTVTDNSDGTLTVVCSSAGDNTAAFVLTDGVLGVVSTPATVWQGGNNVSSFNGTDWVEITSLADYVASGVFASDTVIDEAWLATNATRQNTIAKDVYDIEINFKVGSQNKAISPARQGADRWYSGYNGKSYFVPIEGGVYYMVTANATTWVSFLKTNVSGAHNSAVTNFATGETACHTISSGKSVILKAPLDAKYLLVTYYNYGDITPKSVTKISLFNVFNKANFVNFDNTTSKLESNNVQDAIVEVLNIADLADKRGVYKLTTDDVINTLQINGSVGSWVYSKYTSGYATSKPIYLHKGDTVNLSSFGQYHSTCAFAEWHMNNYKILVTYDMWAAGVRSYTAERDMFVCVSGLATNNLGAVTVVRNSILINNLANYHYDDNHNDYFYRLFGEIRVPTFTVTEGKYINNGVIATDTWSLYTSPIFLNKGECIFVSFTGSNASNNIIFSLSDSEGNIISTVSNTTRSGFGRYPTINMYQAVEDCYVIISGRGRNIKPYIVSDSVLQSYFNRIEGEAKGDIMSLWGTSETLLKLRQLNRPYNDHNTSEGPADKRKGAYNPWIIIHFSDIHNDSTNIRRIETFANYYKQQTDHLNTTDVLIDDVLDTGDNVLATAGGSIPWNASNIAATFLNTIGNHDIENMNNFTFDGLTGWPAVYKKQMGQFRSQWGNVVFPDENVEEEGKCYYYKDYTSQNIRLIVLMNWSNTTAAYMSNEYAWFKDVLDDALAKNLTVVCAGHVKPANLTPIDGCTFHAHEYGYETQSNASQFVILVDKFIRAGGTFACWLAGHTHYDLTGWVNAKYTEDGTEHIVDNQLCLVVENAGGQDSEYERRYWNSDNRIAGTKSQDCFNIVCVNAAYYRVSVMRIGSQYDNSGQHKGGFCINYKTKKMLSCY